MADEITILHTMADEITKKRLQYMKWKRWRWLGKYARFLMLVQTPEACLDTIWKLLSIIKKIIKWQTTSKEIVNIKVSV